MQLTIESILARIQKVKDWINTAPNLSEEDRAEYIRDFIVPVDVSLEEYYCECRLGLSPNAGLSPNTIQPTLDSKLEFIDMILWFAELNQIIAIGQQRAEDPATSAAHVREIYDAISSINTIVENVVVL